MNWRRGKLGDFVTLKRGYDLPESRRVNGPIPVVSSSGVTGCHNEAKVSAPGVVTGRYGTLGEVYYIDEDYWPLNTALYVRDFHGNQPRFVAYFLRHLLGNTQSDKAAVPGVNRNDLHEREVCVPGKREQEAIARVLSAYDGLIENNTRRITLLEQAARLLYEEWFVRLRFPGHEHVRVYHGAPDGWEKTPLSDLATIVMGQSPKSTYYNEEGEGLPFHQGVANFGVRFPEHKTYCTVANRVAEPGDILFSVRAPVGRINITTDKIIVGRGLSAIRSKFDQQNWLFYALRSHFFKEDMMGGGAIFAAITKTDLYGVKLLKPTDRLIELFMEHVRPIDAQIAALHRATELAREARELLLPRLMSGEVVV